VICSSCGAENKAGRKFCIKCGTGLALTCASCGSPLEPGALFCGECGAPVTASGDQTGGGGAPHPSVPPAPAIAERRLVTILFADLVGFTTLAEGRDAEETRELLSRYFDLSRDVIGRYGGTVEKFIGDAVMAVWGAPAAHEDDAERAVRAAIELVDAVRSLGPSIQARAGVLTGEAAVTIGATNQGMVAGDLVNTASRLQSVAQPGTVLVGEATRHAAARAITFEEAGEQVLKGKASPVAAWRALRVVAERGGRNRSETLEAPFVGREDDLRLLKDLFHATGREGRARLVSVVGPGGIGKTRLAWEFLKYLDGLAGSVWFHDGRSPAYGEGISFWALGEMVRRRAGLLETDDEATTRAKLQAALEQHVPEPAERRWIEPALLTLLGFESGVGSDQLFGAWRTFFERLASTAPVVMVFEDFHFADSGLLDFVDHLMEWSRNVPIYVVTLARPELLEKRETWGAGKRNFTSLYLEPLSEPAMRKLLTGLVPGLPESAVRTIVARADGIPLYAVETVRMLLTQGKLVLEGDAYVPVGDLAALAVPETLTALIASRLDGLAPEDRALVQHAAVLGQSFTLAGVSAVSGIVEAELEPRLRSLVRREILRVEADPRSPERGQYAFIQALIREVAYNTLARADRKARHLAAARFFESLGTDELAGALAGHYLAAQANAPDGSERDALASQARIALKAAGERAAGLGAHEQAVVFFEQARSVARDPGEEAELLQAAGESWATAGHGDEAQQALGRALEIRRGSGDRQAAARSALALARVTLDQHQSARMIEVVEALAGEFADLPSDPSVLALHGQVARASYLMGRERQAITAADAVLEAAERLDIIPVVADTLVTRGSALLGLGRAYEGLGALEAGLRLADERDLHYVALRARINYGFFQLFREPGKAMPVLREGLRVARRLGDQANAVTMTANLSAAAFHLGESDLALAEIESLMAMDPDPVARRWLLGNAMLHWTLRGDPADDALAELERGSREVTDPQFVAFFQEVRSYLAFVRGDHREARALSRAVAATTAARAPNDLGLAARYALFDHDAPGARADAEALRALGNHGPAIEVRAREVEAGLAALEGKSAASLSLYRGVIERWDALGMVVDSATTVLEMATLLEPADPQVRSAAETARRTFVRIGAKPFLERLDAAMSPDNAGSLQPPGTNERAAAAGTTALADR